MIKYVVNNLLLENNPGALNTASSQGDIGGIRAAIASGEKNLDTALLYSAKYTNDPLVIQYLLDHGANLNSTALRLAVFHGNDQVTKILLEKLDTIPNDIYFTLRYTIDHNRYKTIENKAIEELLPYLDKDKISNYIDLHNLPKKYKDLFKKYNLV